MNGESLKGIIFRFLNWKLSPEELDKQVLRYHTLKVTESSRGQATLWYSFMLVIPLAIGIYFGVPDLSFWILATAIYVPFIYFAYKGYQWAMVVLVIFETVDRIAQVDTGVPWIIVLIWWAILASVVYKAYQVEDERKKRVIDGSSK